MERHKRFTEGKQTLLNIFVTFQLTFAYLTYSIATHYHGNPFWQNAENFKSGFVDFRTVDKEDWTSSETLDGTWAEASMPLSWWFSDHLLPVSTSSLETGQYRVAIAIYPPCRFPIVTAWWWVRKLTKLCNLVNECTRHRYGVILMHCHLQKQNALNMP